MLNKLTPPHSYLFFIISKYLLVSKTKKKTIESHKRRSCGCRTAECPKTVVEKWNDDCDECSFIHYKKNIDTETEGDLYTKQRKMEMIKQHQKLIINRINNNNNNKKKGRSNRNSIDRAQMKVIADHQWGSETKARKKNLKRINVVSIGPHTHTHTPPCCNKSTKAE